jgi:beta-lactamase class C
LALWCNSIAKTGGAVKNRAMNRMKIFAILIGALLAAAPVRGQDNVEAIVAQKVQPIVPGNGKGGGVAVAVRINGETRFFNYGFANDARNERVTADSIFNLGSVGKLFATTTLAEAVKRGELSLEDPVAKYVTELQRGGDIRRITLGQLASHTSGLPNRPGGNTSGGIEANTRGQISSGFLIPGRRTRSMSLGSSICIRIAPWFCCG